MTDVSIALIVLGIGVIVIGNAVVAVIVRRQVRKGRPTNLYAKGGSVVFVIGGALALTGLALSGRLNH